MKQSNLAMLMHAAHAQGMADALAMHATVARPAGGSGHNRRPDMTTGMFQPGGHYSPRTADNWKRPWEVPGVDRVRYTPAGHRWRP